MGALESRLADKLSRLPSDEKLRVTVSLRSPMGVRYLDKFTHSLDELISDSRRIESIKPETSMEEVLNSHSIGRGTALSDFCEIIQLTKSKIQELAFDPRVMSIEEYVSGQLNLAPAIHFLPSLFQASPTEDVVTLAKSAYSHSQTTLPSGIATSVKAATFEFGLESNFVSCLNRSPAVTWDSYTTSDIDLKSHSLTSFNILANAAPGASLYHRASNYDIIGSIPYISNNGLNVVSVSFNINALIIPHALAVDDFAYRYPYPTFALSAGNDGVNAVSNWYNAYNQLSIGNVQDSDYTHFRIDEPSGCGINSSTKNPPPVYGICISGSGPTCPGDREMPYLVAPGWAPRARVGGSCLNGTQYLTGTSTSYPIWMKGACVPNTGSIYDSLSWGTSMSTPTAAGMVADIMGGASFIKSYPELIRAVVLLTARNVSGGYWQSGIDGIDGAGVIHGSDARAWAQSMTSVSPNGTAVEKGYYYTSFSSGDFTAQTARTLNVKIPNPIPAGKHLRIVLTWDSSPDLASGANNLSDIDLEFDASSQAFYSSSWDSNIEILDITSGVSAGSTYVCKIKPMSWHWSSGARSTSIYAALAWGYVTDHAR